MQSASYIDVLQDLCSCVLPSAELLDAVKASMRIITGNVRHTKGEYPPFLSFLWGRDGDSLQDERNHTFFFKKMFKSHQVVLNQLLCASQ